MAEITVGRIVLYRLSEADAQEINRRRVPNVGHGDNWPAGAQAHVGNFVTAGEECPFVVVASFGGEYVNGQVLLDGTDSYWATSRKEGTENGTWHWPERV